MKRMILLIASLLPLAAGAEAPELGRLFSTPAERAALDARRGQGGAALPPPSEIEPAQAEAGPPPALTVNGVVRRSDGKSTVWINNEAHTDGENRFQSAQKNNPALSLRTPAGATIVLKPGQRYDLERGKVSEADGD